MISRSILETHPLTALKKEISKTNIKGYSKMKKADIIDLMLKPVHRPRFNHIKIHTTTRQPRATRQPKQLEDIPLAMRKRSKRDEIPLATLKVIRKAEKKTREESTGKIIKTVKKKIQPKQTAERATKISAPARIPQKAVVIAPKTRVPLIPKVIKGKPAEKAKEKPKATPKATKSKDVSFVGKSRAVKEDENYVLSPKRMAWLKAMLLSTAKETMPSRYYEEQRKYNAKEKKYEKTHVLVIPPLGDSAMKTLAAQKSRYDDWDKRAPKEQLRQNYSQQKASGKGILDKRFKKDGLFSKWNSYKNPYGVYNSTVPGRTVENSLISKQFISDFGTMMIAKYYPEKLPAWLKSTALEALKILEKRTRESLAEMAIEREKDLRAAELEGIRQGKIMEARMAEWKAKKKIEDEKDNTRESGFLAERKKAIDAANKKDGYKINISNEKLRRREIWARDDTYKLPIVGGKTPKTANITGTELLSKKFLNILKKVYPIGVKEIEENERDYVTIKVERWVRKLQNKDNVKPKQLKAVMDEFRK